MSVFLIPTSLLPCCTISAARRRRESLASCSQRPGARANPQVTCETIGHCLGDQNSIFTRDYPATASSLPDVPGLPVRVHPPVFLDLAVCDPVERHGHERKRLAGRGTRERGDSPVCVPRKVQGAAPFSPSATMSSIVPWTSGAVASMAVNSCRAPASPRGQTGVSAVWKTKCGEKPSSINASHHHR